MPRPKTLSDADVLDAALDLLHARGPEALTFAALARACGLSASTLVQRFASKAGLKRCTLLHAWDRLDEKTACHVAALPRTPAGAVALLVELSRDYGGIESFADGLLVLREDFRDPVLRSRGAAWQRSLSAALEDRFVQVAHAPPGIGALLATHWQGALLWWAFDPQEEVTRFVADSLERFVAAVVAPRRAV